MELPTFRKEKDITNELQNLVKKTKPSGSIKITGQDTTGIRGVKDEIVANMCIVLRCCNLKELDFSLILQNQTNLANPSQ